MNKADQMKKYLLLVSITIVSVIIDQITKLAIVDKFYLGESIPVINNFFHFTYVRNTGAAFGMLGKLPEAVRVPFFVMIPIVALVLVGYYYYKTPYSNKFTLIAFSLISGGAIGNLIDRARLNYVIDFLHFFVGDWHFAVFNIADSVITVGVAIILIGIIYEDYIIKRKKVS